VEGDTLEKVWEKRGDEDRNSVVAELAIAVSKLHCVGMSDLTVQTVFRTFLSGNDHVLESIQEPGNFGGPSTGFIHHGIALLDAVMERRKLKTPFCFLESSCDSQNLKVVSAYEDLGSIIIDKSEIVTWSEDAVFCHNDLTPRNIIIHSSIDHNGMFKYKLAGIIDWELIWESRQRCLLERNNIPAHIRKGILEVGILVRVEEPYAGWRRLEGQVVEIDSTAAQILEDDLVEEMIAKRANERR
jgi:hypothetical protein